MTKFLTKCAILLGGLYATGLALWHLGSTAVFVYESVRIPGVVIDVKERPFEDVFEKMLHGNMPWEGDTAYQPYVRYTLYGHIVTDDSLPDLDSRNYTNGQEVEIILHPRQTHRRHLHSARFLWVGDTLLLALGILLLLISRWLLKRKKKQSKKAPAPTQQEKRPAPQKKETHTPPPAPPAEVAAEPEFKLTAEPEEEAPRKRRRKSAGTSTRTKKTPADPNKPKRTRSKKNTSDGSAEPKAPAKRRRKKQEPA